MTNKHYAVRIFHNDEQNFTAWAAPQHLVSWKHGTRDPWWVNSQGGLNAAAFAPEIIVEASSPEAAAELMFENTNAPWSNDADGWRTLNGYRGRSLSVGDVVVLDECHEDGSFVADEFDPAHTTAMACGGIGWSEVSYEDAMAAVRSWLQKNGRGRMQRI